eukprot:524242-Pelagomonas_calceolata.AAC.1
MFCCRDGLQNEKQNISTDVKVEFINKLSASGLKAIEATSFVSPKWVPQLADGADVMARIMKQTGDPVLPIPGTCSFGEEQAPVQLQAQHSKARAFTIVVVRFHPSAWAAWIITC